MLKGIYRCMLVLSIRAHDFIYRKMSALGMRYYGLHPKHLFDDFHKFFTDNIPQGSTVLDIGCSRGELTADLALKASRVVAYDISSSNIEFAQKRYNRRNIRYFVGEATRNMPQGEEFDVAVCSNILEHLKDPENFLKKLNNISRRVLVRVPNLDNNWILGVKKDLKMKYFLDPQHHREYTTGSIKRELDNAGWIIETMEVSSEIRIAARRGVRPYAK
ncbi:MAG: class I SAM-dependent methyltransferase [Candidatus Omnitrophica bacterium]|nr:class I SAM-dependent methyltransferase [Candidatus Omnitrophota bacterium]